MSVPLRSWYDGVLFMLRLSNLPVVTAVLLAVVPMARAQFTQQGSKIASPVVPPAAFGIVSVSADGNTAVVGAPNVTINTAADTGSAWVYTRANGVWTKGMQLDDSTSGAAGAKQGLSVAISLSAGPFTIPGRVLPGFTGCRTGVGFRKPN